MTNQIYTDKTEYLKYFNFINGAIQTESWNKIYKIKNNLNMYSSNPTAFTDLYVEGAGINYWNCSQKGVGGGCGPVRPDTAHNHQIDYFCRVHMIRRHLIYKRNKKLTSFSISTALCFTWPEKKNAIAYFVWGSLFHSLMVRRKNASHDCKLVFDG